MKVKVSRIIFFIIIIFLSFEKNMFNFIFWKLVVFSPELPSSSELPAFTLIKNFLQIITSLSWIFLYIFFKSNLQYLTLVYFRLCNSWPGRQTASWRGPPWLCRYCWGPTGQFLALACKLLVQPSPFSDAPVAPPLSQPWMFQFTGMYIL